MKNSRIFFSLLLCISLVFSTFAYASPAASAEETLNKELTLEFASNGLEDLDAIIGASSLTLNISTAQKDTLALSFSADIPFFSPIRVIALLGRETSAFAFPGLLDTVYCVNNSVFEELIGQAVTASGYVGTSAVAVPSSVEPSVMAEQLTEILAKYLAAFSELVSEENIQTSTKMYPLEMLEETVECKVYMVRPSAAAWENVLSEILETAKNDEQLFDFLEDVIANGYDPSGETMSQEEYVSSAMEELKEMLNSLSSEDIHEAASILSRFSVEAAMGNNGRVYAVKFLEMMSGSLSGNTLFSYESAGTVSDYRTDVISAGVDGELFVLAYNNLTEKDGAYYGTLEIPSAEAELNYGIGRDEYNKAVFTVNLDTPGFYAEIDLYSGDDATRVFYAGYEQTGLTLETQLTISDSSAEISIPSGLTEKKITTNEELMTALSEIAEAFENL